MSTVNYYGYIDIRFWVRRLSQAEDLINWKYGLYTIGSPHLLGMNDVVMDRIPFGSPQDIEELYSDPESLLASD